MKKPETLKQAVAQYRLLVREHLRTSAEHERTTQEARKAEGTDEEGEAFLDMAVARILDHRAHHRAETMGDYIVSGFMEETSFDQRDGLDEYEDWKLSQR